MYDYLIVGHGLAGCVLAHELLDRGYSVYVLDQPQDNRSSAVAAGLYNPVTGRQMVKTWMADELFPVIEPTYERLEEKLGGSFLHKIGIYRPFWSNAELNDWEGKSADEKYAKFIRQVSGQPDHRARVNDPFGGIHLSQSGYLDVPALLGASRTFLVQAGCYENTLFSEEELVLDASQAKWRHLYFKRIVFCNGLYAIGSRFFSWLPFRPVKGEIIDAELEKPIETIYNRGIFVLPLGEKQVRIGATYQHQYSDLQPTEEGINELKSKYGQLMYEKMTVKTSRAGLRPATKDRRPFIGKHPDYEHIYAFNGFGSKGVSLIPFFSRHFVEYLDGQIALNSDVDLNRYASLRT